MQRLQNSLKTNVAKINTLSENFPGAGITVGYGIGVRDGRIGLNYNDDPNNLFCFFNADTDTGLYDDFGSISFAASGLHLTTVGGNAFTTTSDMPTFTIAATTTSSSSSSGALKILGGFGIGGNLNIGGVLGATVSVTPPFTADSSHGSVSNPSYAFTSETSTGFWCDSSNSVQFVLGGSPALTVGNTSASISSGLVTTFSSTGTSALAVSGGSGVAKNVNVGGVLASGATPSLSFPLRLANGTAAAPSYTFQSASTSGLYYDNALCYSIAGTQRIRLRYSSASDWFVGIGSTNTSGLGVAIGWGATTNSVNAVAIGRAAQATGDAVAIGSDSAAAGPGVAIGTGTTCTSGYGSVAIGAFSTAGYNSIVIGYQASGSGGVVMIGSYSVYSYAHLDTTSPGGTWHSSSDERFKTNIEEMNIGMDLLRIAQPCYWKWKAIEGSIRDTTETHVGFTYQKLLAALNAVGISKHECVSKADNEPYGEVSTTAILPHIVRGLVELEQKIEENEALLVAKGW